MARLARLSLANQVHYVRLYGVKELSLIPMIDDLDVLLGLFSKITLQYKEAIAGYVLLPEQLDLLVIPEESAEQLSKFIQTFSRLYSRYFNTAYGRSGTIWHGRFHSSVIQGSERIMESLLYLESLPERKGIQEAQTYPWSSFFHHAGLRNDYFMTPVKEYWALGNTPFERQKNYKQIFPRGCSSKNAQEIEKHLKMGWPWADKEFLLENGVKLERIEPERKRGRPKKINS